MKLKVNGIEISYDRHHGNGMPVILLHGWGGSRLSFKGVYDFLVSKDRNAVNIDLPGFGDSSMPPESFGITDYAEIIDAFIKELSIEKAVLVGHSFGGRIAIILASEKQYIDSIVLVDSAGMRPRRKLSYYINVWKYKRAKKRGDKLEDYGSADYRALPPSMQKVFVRVVNEHLEPRLKNIRCSSLIIWGENDNDTPMYMARRLKRKIRDSGLVTLPNCGHYSYVQSHAKFCVILWEFIRSKK